MNNIQRWCIIGFIGVIAISIFLFALSGRYKYAGSGLVLDRWTGNLFYDDPEL